MYDEHLEIANPGSLHFGMTPEKLVQPHESRPWNPIIAGFSIALASSRNGVWVL
jgi:predicted HTH transcriptional regulator